MMCCSDCVRHPFTVMRMQGADSGQLLEYVMEEIDERPQAKQADDSPVPYFPVHQKCKDYTDSIEAYL